MSHAIRSPRRRLALFACSLLVCIAGTQGAHASSADAWEEFVQDVNDKCVSAAQGIIQVMRVEVDDYGSESYGFAVLFGFQQGDPKQRLLVCAYSKRDQTAEVSAPFEL